MNFSVFNLIAALLVNAAFGTTITVCNMQDGSISGNRMTELKKEQSILENQPFESANQNLSIGQKELASQDNQLPVPFQNEILCIAQRERLGIQNIFSFDRVAVHEPVLSQIQNLYQRCKFQSKKLAEERSIEIYEVLASLAFTKSSLFCKKAEELFSKHFPMALNTETKLLCMFFAPKESQAKVSFVTNFGDVRSVIFSAETTAMSLGLWTEYLGYFSYLLTPEVACIPILESSQKQKKETPRFFSSKALFEAYCKVFVHIGTLTQHPSLNFIQYAVFRSFCADFPLSYTSSVIAISKHLAAKHLTEDQFIEVAAHPRTTSILIRNLDMALKLEKESEIHEENKYLKGARTAYEKYTKNAMAIYNTIVTNAKLLQAFNVGNLLVSFSKLLDAADFVNPYFIFEKAGFDMFSDRFARAIQHAIDLHFFTEKKKEHPFLEHSHIRALFDVTLANKTPENVCRFFDQLLSRNGLGELLAVYEFELLGAKASREVCDFMLQLTLAERHVGPHVGLRPVFLVNVHLEYEKIMNSVVLQKTVDILRDLHAANLKEDQAVFLNEQDIDAVLIGAFFSDFVMQLPLMLEKSSEIWRQLQNFCMMRGFARLLEFYDNSLATYVYEEFIANMRNVLVTLVQPHFKSSHTPLVDDTTASIKAAETLPIKTPEPTKKQRAKGKSKKSSLLKK